MNIKSLMQTAALVLTGMAAALLITANQAAEEKAHFQMLHENQMEKFRKLDAHHKQALKELHERIVVLEEKLGLKEQ